MAAGHASLPAGRVPGHRRRQRARRAPGLVRARALRRRARRPVRRPGAGRHVPPLAVLPAAPVVDQAVRARGAGLARVPALRLEQPDRRSSPSSGRSRPSSWTARRTSRRGPRWRPASTGVRRAGRDRRPLRLPLGAHAPRGGPDGATFTLETTDGEYRCRVLVLAVGVAEPWSPSTPGIEHARHYAETREAPSVRGQAAVHHRQAELGLRARVGPRGVGVEDHGRVAVARQDRRSQTQSLVGVRARYVQPFEDNFLGLGVSILDASIDAIEHVGERPPGRAQADRQRDADERRGRRGHRRDRLHLPAAGPARPRRGRRSARRKLPAVTPFWESATVPGHLLRRHDQPGLAGPQEARHPVELRARSTGTATTAASSPGTSPRALRHVDRPPLIEVADVVPTCSRGDPRARAVAPEGVPRARGLGLGRTTASATRASCRSPTCSTA